jgi:hypothetical protein
MNLADICSKPLGATLFHSFLNPYMFRRPKFIEETKPKKDHSFKEIIDHQLLQHGSLKKANNKIV